MRIGMNIGGDALGTPCLPGETVAQAVQAEANGFSSAWTVHFTRGTDALSTLAAAGTRTNHIELGVGIVPTYPRHPFALAQQAATTQAFCSGRLTLGVGVSHRAVVEGLLGLRYSSPAQHMREYLELLEPLLCGEEVHHFGRYYRVDGGFTVPGTSPVSVVVGALGAQMVDVAGRCSDGVITWLAGPRSLSQDIVPIASAAAADVGRPAPRVIAGVPVMVCEDRDAGRALAERTFARYAGLENYRRLFEREGIGSVADLALVGAEAEVLEGLDALAAAGVTDLWPVVLAADVDSADRATELLAGLQLRAGLTAIQAGVR